MLKVGLTGGIGSGKTIVSDTFSNIGIPVIDTDVIAREVLKNNTELLLNLANTFGNDILVDGILNRTILRERAFISNDSKSKLDAIMHPAIRQETLQRIKITETKALQKYCIIVVPLLVETNFKEFVDRILVVTAPHELKLTWLKSRSNLSSVQAEKIMSKQSSDDEKLTIADDHIENNSCIKELKEKVMQMNDYYLGIS